MGRNVYTDLSCRELSSGFIYDLHSAKAVIYARVPLPRSFFFFFHFVLIFPTFHALPDVHFVFSRAVKLLRRCWHLIFFFFSPRSFPVDVLKSSLALLDYCKFLLQIVPTLLSSDFIYLVYVCLLFYSLVSGLFNIFPRLSFSSFQFVFWSFRASYFLFSRF